jgi:hypothetical protein
MYRDKPTYKADTGWCFMSGRETQDYMDDAANLEIYDVNTIANYDPDIIPFLDAPIGTAFERDGPLGKFIQVGGKQWEPNNQDSGQKKWPPPGFPLVKGDHRLTETWLIHLPEEFARRKEDKSLVLWRPGLTLWLTAWNNDHSETQEKRLASIKGTAPKDRSAEQEVKTNNLMYFSYRLRDQNETGSVESLYAFVIGADGHLQMAFYFDDPADETEARQLASSVTEVARNAAETPQLGGLTKNHRPWWKIW